MHMLFNLVLPFEHIIEYFYEGPCLIDQPLSLQILTVVQLLSRHTTCCRCAREQMLLPQMQDRILHFCQASLLEMPPL